MKLALTVALIIVVCGYVTANDKPTAKVYCGRRLANAIAALCAGEPEMMKRDPGWWLSPNNVQILEGERGKRGPVDECCNKPCTIDELLTYCYTE